MMSEKSQVYCNQSQLFKLAEKVKGSLFSVKPDQLFATGIVYKTLQLCQNIGDIGILWDVPSNSQVYAFCRVKGNVSQIE